MFTKSSSFKRVYNDNGVVTLYLAPILVYHTNIPSIKINVNSEVDDILNHVVQTIDFPTFANSLQTRGLGSIDENDINDLFFAGHLGDVIFYCLEVDYPQYKVIFNIFNNVDTIAKIIGESTFAELIEADNFFTHIYRPIVNQIHSRLSQFLNEIINHISIKSANTLIKKVKVNRNHITMETSLSLLSNKNLKYMGEEIISILRDFDIYTSWNVTSSLLNAKTWFKDLKNCKRGKYTINKTINYEGVDIIIDIIILN